MQQRFNGLLWRGRTAEKRERCIFVAPRRGVLVSIPDSGREGGNERSAGGGRISGCMERLLWRCLAAAALVCVLGTGAAGAKTVRVMSFNLRYDLESDSVNKWSNRADDVHAFIERLAPDVVGMQEVLPNQMEYLRDSLEDYDCYSVPREDGKEEGQAASIFFRKERFTAVNKGTFWLSPTPDVPSAGWDARNTRLCSWVLLQDTKTNRIFLFANTHFDHLGKDARRESAMLIKEKLAAIANNCPIILAGDFNCTDDSEPYRILCSRVFRLEDVHKTARKVTGQRSTLNAWGTVDDAEERKIDFIFATPGVEVKRSHIYNALIGEGRYLSDHNPYYVDLDDELL